MDQSHGQRASGKQDAQIPDGPKATEEQFETDAGNEGRPPGFVGGIFAIFFILASSSLVMVYSVRNGNLWLPVENFVDTAAECLLGSKQCGGKTSKSVALNTYTKPTVSPTPTRRSRRSAPVNARNPTPTLPALGSVPDTMEEIFPTILTQQTTVSPTPTSEPAQGVNNTTPSVTQSPSPTAGGSTPVQSSPTPNQSNPTPTPLLDLPLVSIGSDGISVKLP